MTSFYSPASHFRHPWFDHTLAKRKQPMPINLNEDMDDEDDSEVRPTKRLRRSTGLENGMAHMSLLNESAPTQPPLNDYMLQQAPLSARPIIEEVRDTSPTGSEASSTSPGSDRQNILLPGSVEEPSVAPEVQMGASSWYEPERDRIVITDLDSYAEDGDAADDGLTVEDMDTPSGLDVNPVFLERLRSSRTALDRLHQVPPSNESRALVLFRPLSFAQAPSPESPEPEPLEPEPLPIEDEDAMDLDE